MIIPWCRSAKVRGSAGTGCKGKSAGCEGAVCEGGC